MTHLPHLIQDLGLTLIIAGVVTLLFKRLKQPVVLGYIVAGLLVSPHFPLFPTITDIESIHIWADIGVIFLLFTLGLEFSFKKLMRVGGAAAVTALIEISAMLGIGFLVGYMMGWQTMDCIFLGGILSIASTSIILRSFDESGVKGKRFAQLVFGILVIEDLIAVLLLVLLTTISVTRAFAGTDMLISFLKLIFFLVLWFVAGIFFIPSFFSRVQKHLNNETILIVSLGLCLGMVMLASLAGFPPALGAFMMGSILAETLQAERIEKIVAPVKDLFSAIFFVSVGMLIDPAMLYKYAFPILTITVVLIVCKTLFVTTGAVISGRPLKTSLFAGMSMAQIGEFSFIIASLGLTLKVTNDFLYPVAVAVSVFTTFTTPYMIKLSGPLYEKIEKWLPAKWRKSLSRYSEGAQTINTASDWRIAIRAFAIHVFFLSVVILGIIFFFSQYISPRITQYFSGALWSKILSSILCLAIISPFLWALIMRKLKPEAYTNLWSNRRYRSLLIFLRLVRLGLGIIYVSLFLLSMMPLTAALVAVVILIVLSMSFSKKIHNFYLGLENRFFQNFHNREIQHAIINRHELAPWDAHIVQEVVPVGSSISGQTLEEIAIREKFGINIAMIKRGENNKIIAPGRYERIYPGDKLFIIGTDEQIDLFKKYILQLAGDKEKVLDKQEIVLKTIDVDAHPFLLNRTIRESGIREKTRGIVVGIERSGQRILNPESQTVFKAGDKIWLVGESELIRHFKEVMY